ncbi:uncharacterized protein ATNIH1004_002104 [Aspergillus tanneri]|uniref:Uncharacterized protein n=1 Tax=Aspergillus tanneri TaxID=1220188 RepID=A0A5M9MX06_9EURO|nr:uncharacterized protein ATNIH1004_002104 [Aspergillus tanneri]KAA8649433.1 hypothetical protein ATNIH1004_002104 [Aspergillus tanneri]
MLSSRAGRSGRPSAGRENAPRQHHESALSLHHDGLRLLEYIKEQNVRVPSPIIDYIQFAVSVGNDILQQPKDDWRRATETLQESVLAMQKTSTPVGIHVDAQAIVRRLPAQKQLMRFAASISRSIDPRQPYKLDDTSHVNEIPRKVTKGLSHHARRALKGVKKYEKEYTRANQRYQRAQCEFRNEWQRQRNRLVRENLERYKNEQPVIDSERQLSGKLVDEEVLGALERTGYITPQHIILIDTVLTMPGSTVKKEYQRRIAAVNAALAFCDVEEGSPSRRPILPRKGNAVP